METVVSERANKFNGYTALQTANGSVAVALNKLYHIVLTNMSSKSVHIPKHMPMTHITYILPHIVLSKATLLKINPKTIGTVCHKLALDRNTHRRLRKE